MPPYQVTSAQAPALPVPARRPTGCTGAVGPAPGFGVTRVAPPSRLGAPPPEPAGGELVTPRSGPPLPVPAAAWPQPAASVSSSTVTTVRMPV